MKIEVYNSANELVYKENVFDGDEFKALEMALEEGKIPFDESMTVKLIKKS